MSKGKDPKQKQVSLAGAARSKPEGGKKKRRSRAWIIWLCLALVIVAVVVGYKLFQNRSAGPSLAPREFVEYTYTADDKLGDVAYYALGISGAKTTDRLDALAIMCFDRAAKKITVLQVPTAMYIEKGETFAVSTAGDVWGRPKGKTWCKTCRGYVAADAVEDKKHTVCGTEVTAGAGSSTTDLARLFNTQFGLPVDNYLVIPRDGLAQLIDGVGGVTVKLDKELNVGGIKYAAGDTTLPGEAAVYYAIEYDYDGSAALEAARMKRQRQVYAALLARLSEREVSQLYSESEPDILSALMNGSNPIRFDTTSFGKARLLGKADDSATDNTRFGLALAQFLHEVSAVDLQNVVCSIVPGENTKNGSSTVYSAYRAETMTLLKEQMNPHGLTIDDTTVGVKELKKTENSNAYIAALSTVIVEQKPLEEPQTEE